MLTAAEVSKLLGISARLVYDLFHSGKLAGYRMGLGRGAVRFARADVDAYKAQQPASSGLLSARELRTYERLRVRAEKAGGDAPLLDKAQLAIAARRVRRLRMAPWADAQAIAAIYADAKRMSRETGIPHHVDHITPLQGDFVSGLHVETNLRVLPARENAQKGNRYEPC